ncbi:DUF2645 family protein [Pectobacterium atrosepticum]|uniref:DUF2645 family protein n=1 Tax=Pectobacterium versatile TaxID=2488639 RepID=UPI000F8EFD3E|nr:MULTISPECIES: DUF2645 family protein [Pectobacterium]MCL6373069.1 DUF2645 family protein [Pectobacterium atrosepticum]RUR93846.1 Inner membrane protein YjeO [Pectobacterium versatile]
MNNNIIKSTINIIMVIYSFFVIITCMMGGVFKEEWFIDGDEIKNVCDVLRAIVVDDYRETVAIATLALITPVVIYGALNKFRIISINIMLLVFLFVWIWFFIVKYRNCLWF